MGIFLLLSLSMVVAVEPVSIINEPIVVLPVFPVTLDDESKVSAIDLWVWLEVPENVPAASGQMFWVDLYITPFQSSIVKTFTLKLKPSNNKVKFTGGVEKVPELPDASGWSQIYANPNDGSLLLSRSIPISWNFLGQKKVRLARLEMVVNSQGNFGISLVKAESEAWYDSLSKYILKQGNTRVIRNSHCVPNPNPCSAVPSAKCGAVDNGCGKIVTCSACASDKICVSNACVSAVSQLPAGSQQACQAVINTPEPSDKVLLQKIGEILRDWGKDCTINACQAGYSCSSNTCSATELSILSPIFTAIKDWLFSKFSP